jgi:hypothetical protein
MTNKQISAKARRSLLPAKVSSSWRHAKRTKRRRRTVESDLPSETPADHGFSVSIHMGPTAIHYAGWLLAAILVLTVCWLAPDAAVLAAKVKAICDALRLLK